MSTSAEALLGLLVCPGDWRPLVKAIRIDPALALWSACAAGPATELSAASTESPVPSDELAVPSIEQLARRAASLLGERLVAEATDAAEVGVDPQVAAASLSEPSADMAQLSSLAAAALVASAQVAQVRPTGRTPTARQTAKLRQATSSEPPAAASPADGAESAYLVALLHQAREMLALCVEASAGVAFAADVTTAAEALLPDWLRVRLDQLSLAIENTSTKPPRKNSPATSSRHAKPAETRSAGAQPLLPEVELVQRAVRGLRRGDPHVKRQLGAARRNWLSGSASLAGLLRPLAVRLRAASHSELCFAEELERQKLEALAEFAAGAGHEMNNPLAVISGRAQLLLRQESNPQRRRELALMQAQAMRVHEMIADLMLFARPPQFKRVPVELVALVDRVVAEAQARAQLRGASIARRGVAEPLWIQADPAALAVALAAVCDNAIEAVDPHDGQIVVTLSTTTGQGATGAQALVAVEDNGPGLSAEQRSHAFEPYYSGRSAGRGLGLGLAKCWRIVTAHGGEVRLEAAPQRGTIATLVLPRDESSHIA